MSRFLFYLRDKHALWYKLILILTCILLVAGFLPSGEKSIPELTAGEVWEGPDLYAPFDFPVYKEDSLFQHELKEARKAAPMIFVCDPSRFKRNIQLFFEKNKLENEIKAKLNRFFDTLLSRNILALPDIFQKGTKIWTESELGYKEWEESHFLTILQADSLIPHYITFEKAGHSDTALLDAIEQTLVHTVIFNPEKTELNRVKETKLVSHILDKVKKGSLIIIKGAAPDERTKRILMGLKMEWSRINQSVPKPHSWILFLSRIIYAALCFSMVFLFLAFFRGNIFSSNTKVTFIFILMVIFYLTAAAIKQCSPLDISIIPFAIAPILIRTFFDSRTALFVHLNIILLSVHFSATPFSLFFAELMGGITAIFSIANLTNRSQLLITAVFVLVIELAANCTSILIGGERILSEDWLPFLYSAPALLLAYPLIYLSEKVFGFISDFTLLELNDTGNELLKRMSAEAPGTFQHSLQVASMTEDAVRMIGGNALLARTGALYHDIGKLENPVYFIENQHSEINPHEDLTFHESASIITGHVINGIEIAHKYHLPEQIIDFIRTHHGTTLVGYFFSKARMSKSEFPTDEQKFRYGGPIPFSAETAVLMLADSVEASSRSLENHDAVSIDTLVDNIFRIKMEENQLLNSDLTLRDLTLLRKIFKTKLMSIYHVRIAYPK